MSEAAVTAPAEGRLARWRHGSFGPASDEPFRRRASDVVRIVIAVAGLALLISHVDHPTRTEQTLFEFFDSLPNTLKPLFEFLYGLGLLWAVGLLAAAAFVARRCRGRRRVPVSHAARATPGTAVHRAADVRGDVSGDRASKRTSRRGPPGLGGRGRCPPRLRLTGGAADAGAGSPLPRGAGLRR